MQFKFRGNSEMASKVLFSFVTVMILMMGMFGGAPTLARDVNVLTDFKAIGDGVTDDSEAFKQAWAAVCTSSDPSNNLIIPSQKTFLVRPISLQGPCKSNSITVQVMGSIVATKQSAPGWIKDKDWLSFSKVNNLIVEGSSTGSINGRASTDDWWNCKKECPEDRPTALGFHSCNNCKVRGLNSWNPPMNHLTINNCDGFSVDNVNFQAPSDSPNTDGIDISASKNVNIFNSFIATGDDCIAINNGSAFINITSLNCGPGHGISVGSLGKDLHFSFATDIHVKNCTFNGTTNGARIKTFEGASGFAKHITFEDITLINAGNPILIDQHYCPHGHCPQPPKNPNAVEVSFVTFKDVHGTTSAKEAIDLDCSAVKHCHNIVLDGITITSTDKIESNCKNADVLTLNNVDPPVKCIFTKSTAATTDQGFISMPVVDQDEEDRAEL